MGEIFHNPNSKTAQKNPGLLFYVLLLIWCQPGVKLIFQMSKTPVIRALLQNYMCAITNYTLFPTLFATLFATLIATLFATTQAKVNHIKDDCCS